VDGAADPKERAGVGWPMQSAKKREPGIGQDAAQGCGL
jgi:hypothetical protein